MTIFFMHLMQNIASDAINKQKKTALKPSNSKASSGFPFVYAENRKKRETGLEPIYKTLKPAWLSHFLFFRGHIWTFFNKKRAPDHYSRGQNKRRAFIVTAEAV